MMMRVKNHQMPLMILVDTARGTISDPAGSRDMSADLRFKTNIVSLFLARSSNRTHPLKPPTPILILSTAYRQHRSLPRAKVTGIAMCPY